MDAEPEKATFAAFARFDVMVTPAIIQMVFWIGATLLVFVRVAYAVSDEGEPSSDYPPSSLGRSLCACTAKC